MAADWPSRWAGMFAEIEFRLALYEKSALKCRRG